MKGRRLAVAVVLAAAVAAVVAIVLLGSGSSPTPRAAASLAPGQTTSVVTRRTLTESSTGEGTLGYGAKVELFNRLAGTFTWLPPVGAVIRRGGTLWRGDNLPVALMYGSVPAYRTLKEGVADGPDVAELNRNLIDLGFDPYGEIEDDEHFGAATAAAVCLWQEAEGLPATGEVELGRIVFAPGARRVTSLKVAVGQDPPPLAAAEAPAAEGPTAEEAAAKRQGETEEKEEEATAAEEEETEKARAEKAKEKEKAAAEEAKKAAEKHPKDGSGSKEPAAEEPAAAEKPSGEKDSPGAGAEAAAAEPVLATTSTRQIVQLQLSAADQGLARVGKSAPVTLPDGDVVKGTITKVGTVAEVAAGGGPEAAGEEGSEPTISVTVALAHPVAHLDEAPVSVALVKQVRRHILAVPATALFAVAGGGYAVQALKGTRRVELAVTPGMFADGYVQIEGRGVHPGLKVTEPSE